MTVQKWALSVTHRIQKVPLNCDIDTYWKQCVEMVKNLPLRYLVCNPRHDNMNGEDGEEYDRIIAENKKKS
uniref:Uncharacterized protein n=1 Tax=Megaselia scalaris TaxID=36166 RepID=T1GW95_MEGSC